MLTLAISSVSRECSVALSLDGKVLSRKALDVDMVTYMPESVNEMIGECGGIMPDKLIISSGPGYYTGTRIGTAFSKGMCADSKCSLTEVDSMDIIAHIAIKADYSDFLCILKARKGYFHSARFRGGIRQEENKVIHESELAGVKDTAIAGEGLLYLPQAVMDANIDSGILYPDACAMLEVKGK